MKYFIFSTAGFFDIFLCKWSCDGFVVILSVITNHLNFSLLLDIKIYIYLPPIKLEFSKLFLLFACLGVKINFLLTQPSFNPPNRLKILKPHTKLIFYFDTSFYITFSTKCNSSFTRNLNKSINIANVQNYPYVDIFLSWLASLKTVK